MNSDHSNKPLQKYEKPKLKVIELAAEEVLSLGCKTAIPPFAKPACTIMSGCLGVGTS